MTRRVALALAALTMILAACTAGNGTSSGPPAKSSHKPVTLTVWSFFTGRELKQFNDVLSGLKKTAPWITINSVGGKGPAAIVQAINSGTATDAVIEAGPDDSAKY